MYMKGQPRRKLLQDLVLAQVYTAYIFYMFVHESRKTRRKQLVENNSPKTTRRKY